MEEWRSISDYPGYEVSNKGRVKSLERMVSCKGNSLYLRRERVLKLKKNQNGYLCVSLCKESICKTFIVHRLVAMAFIPNPEDKPQVNHINGIRHDNTINNLEWCTASENRLHSINILGHTVSESTRNKLSEITTRKNLDNHSTAMSINVNGKTFKNMKEASLYHGKHAGYFSELMRRREINENSCPQWEIRVDKKCVTCGNTMCTLPTGHTCIVCGREEDL